MKKIFNLLSTLFLTGIIFTSVSGCVPLLIGAAAGVGGYAWVKGELVHELNVPVQKVHRAASRAMRDLKLAVYDDKGDRLSAKINAKFVDGTDININVEAKTERSAIVKIRVGLLGDKQKSEMIFSAIKKRL